MAKTVHYAEKGRYSGRYYRACNWNLGGRRMSPVEKPSKINATRTKSRVTCGNCKRTKAWKESK